ncbi:thioredoxin domain-containing protein [Sinomonas notoginsengisoli]|uniref:thioredoxin domain-containing protein n=1 Tax=Sinomonas notoginsengisoli TaxID=1457311 RepID=UPI001F3A875A|nr:thioredoxin domain-containing protein [Sinomonas notoginsengisoli]
MTNRLAGQASAYLRQHADNPVHWQPFGDDAFAEAARREVPVFISIGYAACHWCHVMAHESFEDPATAQDLNERFVSVKVDREERPDVDGAYMAACQAMTGQGGWPLSIFALPDGRAFYAGTYFPPAPRPGQPSFRQVLQAVSEAWRDRRAAVEGQAGALAEALGGLFSDQLLRLDSSAEHDAAGLAALVSGAVVRLAETEDRVHGGFGGAPKFPPSPLLEFLIRHAAGTAETAETARGLAGRTLAAMCRSAVFDTLGGGFARYSVTADWSVPHYEKMLYDNAQLLRGLAHWAPLGGSDGFPADEARAAASLTADWMVRELGLPEGGFASSLDADSERDGRHVEGGYYVWTGSELTAALQDGGGESPADDAARLAAVFGLGVGEHASSARPLHGGRALGPEERALLDRHRPALLTARGQRMRPARDDKAVAGWNGLAVAALADAASALGRPELLGPARAAASLLKDIHWDGTSLARVSHAGGASGIEGLLADYAGCAEGAFALYAVTGEAQWYEWAEELLAVVRGRFVADGLLSDSAADSHAGGGVRAALAGSRSLDPYDAEQPSGTSLLAGTLLTHAAYSGSAEDRALADTILGRLEQLVAQGPRAAGWLLAVAEGSLAGPLEVAVVGPLDGARAEETFSLHRVALLAPNPGLVVALRGATSAGGANTGEGREAAVVPLTVDRPTAPDGGPLAYVCRDFACQLPVGTPEALRGQLASAG